MERFPTQVAQAVIGDNTNFFVELVALCPRKQLGHFKTGVADRIYEITTPSYIYLNRGSFYA